MKFVTWVAVSQTESSSRPSISGGVTVRSMTAVERPRRAGANPPPPRTGERGAASPAGAGRPGDPPPKASAPLTGRSGRASGAAGGTAATKGGGTGTGAGRTPGGGRFGTGRSGTKRSGANRSGAGRLPGVDRPPLPVESRAASTEATSSWISKMSAIPPSTRVPNSTAPVSTSTIRVVMRRASPNRCRLPSIIQTTPCRR